MILTMVMVTIAGSGYSLERSPASGIRWTMAYNVKSVKHIYKSLNIKKPMNLFLFFTVRNTCICALKVFTNSRVTLCFSCSTANTSFIVLRSFSIAS
jgi:hypothetical protein